MAKKRRVPEVLWRLFRKKARTLAQTIISLVSQSRGEAKNEFFLIKPGDPSDYRKLLHQCFVVVNEKAPPLSGFSPVTHWSQHEIVERIMEMSEIMESSNVIYGGFDKYNCSSPILELLSGPSWSLLLERVGENVMCYLLQHTSIFLPLPPKKHHQVTGPSITNHEFFKGKADSQGYQKKRKRVDIASSVSKTQQESSSVGCRISIGCVGCKDKSYVRQFRSHPGYNNGQMTFLGVGTATSDAVAAKNDGNAYPEPQTSCDQVTAKPRKRSRPFSWQRRRNRRHINLQEFSDKIPCTIRCNDIDSSCGKHQYDNSRMQETCSWCLMLQAPQLVTDRDLINRRYMFYSLECSSTVLPRWHILNSLKPNFPDSKLLIKKIFFLSDVNKSPQSMTCSHSTEFCLMGSACLYHKLVRLLKILIRRFQSCQHLRLLDKHCVPLSDQKVMGNSSSLFEGNELGKKARGKSNGSCSKDCKKSLEASDSHFEAIKPYCLKSQVESFIWAVCRSIIPADLLGTPYNWRVLRRNISKFIQLRRFEKFSIKQCMHKLKISKFPFLSDKHSSCYLKTQVPKDSMEQNVKMYEEFNKLNNPMVKMKHKLLVNWIFWFFSNLVVPLVQANFYVTESEHGKQDIYYYRKSVWENLMNKAITRLKDKSYCQLDDAAVRSVISHRSFGFSKLRLLPKENGVRMLANLKAPSRLAKKEFKDTCTRMPKDAQMRRKRVKCDHYKPVNGVLRDIHAVLKGLVLKEPDKLGSSVFDYNDVYRKLCPFLIGLRNGSTTIPGIFVVVSDVSKAFDSIDQDKLLSVMNDVILEDKYLLEHRYQVVSTKKSMWIHDNPPVLIDHNVSTCTRFTSSLTFPSLHRILVNQGWKRYVRKEELLFNLNEHVKRNVLQLDKKFYLQGIGIPQGSVISSLLCSLYYGDLERNVIYPFIQKTQESVFQVVSGSHHFGESSRGDTIISSPGVNMFYSFGMLFNCSPSLAYPLKDLKVCT
ncbi:telomerase reverse transcriptase-like [Pistacia vera]|uniref:telomerase reverse transcriptase-like n=1 Tax=Pistacia vera TaxID=55513 RepID=UPI0012634A06|nr:telomerase reverse transcriptase-like [Pistacia vera]